MLKSLEKLKAGCWFPPGKDIPDYSDTKNIVNEIQAEVDEFYWKKPLFEDGEPANFGMEYVTYKGEVEEIEQFVISEECVEVNLCGDHVGWTSYGGHRLKRPFEDTQEKIDADAELYAMDYCRKYGLVSTNENETAGVLKSRHLLKRQRKLDGVEL